MQPFENTYNRSGKCCGIHNEKARSCVSYSMKYLDLLLTLDVLYRHYPRYHSHELFTLAEDIWKWMNNELPQDSSAIVYLQSCFNSPSEALGAIRNEIQLFASPYIKLN